ncbi:hypothetical protein BB558_006245 [Smittium angustum]|nr:hypothetical protein BB558_006245 [Smittium angustum]
MAYLPGDYLFNLLQAFSPYSDILISVVDGMTKGYGITTAGVDLVKFKLKPEKVSESIVAMIVIGTVTGAGGGMISDLFQLTQKNWAFRTPTMFTSLSIDLKLSFFTTIGYIFTTKLWSFSSAMPNFVFSKLFDGIINTVIPSFTTNEAKLVFGTVCSCVLGYKAYMDYNIFVEKQKVLKSKTEKDLKSSSKSKNE